MKKEEQDLINELDAFVYDDTEEVLEFFGSREEPVVEISLSVLLKFIDQKRDEAMKEGKREGYAEGIVDAVKKLNPEAYQLLGEFVGEHYKVVEEILKLLNK